MGRSRQNPDSTVTLPDPLRKVLGSASKVAILCHIESGITDTEKLEAQMGLRRNTLNAHLRELEEAGWIRIAELRKRRGVHARIWALSHPDFSWLALVAHLRRDVPQPEATSVPPAFQA